MTVRARVLGEEFDVQLRPGGVVDVRDLRGASVVFDGAVSVESQTAVVVVDGRTRRADVAFDGSAWWVHCDGRAFRVELDDGGAAHPRARHRAHDTLAAPMPATVVRVDVSPGQVVETADVLVVLEAMKMQMPLRAPHRAIVRVVACSAGELVQPLVPLVELDELD